MERALQWTDASFEQSSTDPVESSELDWCSQDEHTDSSSTAASFAQGWTSSNWESGTAQPGPLSLSADGGDSDFDSISSPSASDTGTSSNWESGTAQPGPLSVSADGGDSDFGSFSSASASDTTDWCGTDSVDVGATAQPTSTPFDWTIDTILNSYNLDVQGGFSNDCIRDSWSNPVNTTEANWSTAYENPVLLPDGSRNIASLQAATEANWSTAYENPVLLADGSRNIASLQAASFATIQGSGTAAISDNGSSGEGFETVSSHGPRMAVASSRRSAPKSVGHPILRSALQFQAESPTKTSRVEPSQIEEAMRFLCAFRPGPRIEDDRQTVWRMAEMLLNDDSYEFQPRPMKLSGTPAVFREDQVVRRRPGSDKWMSSGQKGSPTWPGKPDTPRLRIKYGRVKSSEQAETTRYHMYTFIDNTCDGSKQPQRQLRRLFVAYGNSALNNSDDKLAPLATAAPSTARTEALATSNTSTETTASHPPVTAARKALPDLPSDDEQTVETLVAALETQAAAEVRTIDLEEVYRLLTYTRRLNATPNARIASFLEQFERPDVLLRAEPRIFVEIDTGKRRKLARARRGKSAQGKSAQLFDMWLNSGGKRGVVRLHTSTGAIVERRAGRIEARGHNPSRNASLKYVQYSLKSDSASSGSATVFHVFVDRDHRAQLKPDPTPIAEVSANSKRRKVLAGCAASLAMIAFVAYATMRSKAAVPTVSYRDKPWDKQHQCQTTNRWDSEVRHCQHTLDSFCNSVSNSECTIATASAYGDAALPMVALYDSDLSGYTTWRCYSALSLKNGRWDGKSPGYCSEDSKALRQTYEKCTPPGEPALPKTLTPRCENFLAEGGSCLSDFGFGKPYAGACNLACGFDSKDTAPSSVGIGACKAAIASGNCSCEVDFAPGGKLAGQCDFECGYCTESDQSVSQSELCSSEVCRCSTSDTYDNVGTLQRSPGDACKAALVTGQLSCAVDFAYGGVFQGLCDRTCGFNVYDTQAGAGTCAKAIATGRSCKLDFSPTGPYSGLCDFECNACVPSPPSIGLSTCQTVNQYDLATGHDGLCDAYVNFPDTFTCATDFVAGGTFASQCNLACGYNLYDAAYGDMQCYDLLASGGLICAVDFAADGKYSGYCDFECGFCAPPPPAHSSPTCNERAQRCIEDRECILLVAQPMQDISLCLANALCRDFITCYPQDGSNMTGQSTQPTTEQSTVPLRLRSCETSGRWQPSYPRDDLDAWAIIREGAVGQSGENMCVTATFVGMGAELVLAPCNPNIRTVAQPKSDALPAYRGWANQSFYVTNCSSFNGAGRIVLAYGSVYLEDRDLTTTLCVSEGQSSDKLSIEPCIYMSAHDFSTTLATWGLYPPFDDDCEGSSRSIENVSKPSVLRDDMVGYDICVGSEVASLTTPKQG